MKEKLVIGLHHLLDKTIMGTRAVSSSLGLLDMDATQLWCMYLGHISKRGMMILSKRGPLDGVKIGKLDFYEYCVLNK